MTITWNVKFWKKNLVYLLDWGAWVFHVLFFFFQVSATLVFFLLLELLLVLRKIKMVFLFPVNFVLCIMYAFFVGLCICECRLSEVIRFSENRVLCEVPDWHMGLKFGSPLLLKYHLSSYRNHFFVNRGFWFLLCYWVGTEPKIYCVWQVMCVSEWQVSMNY